MTRSAYIAALFLAALLLLPVTSPAATEGQVKTFAVLPFKVNGPEKYQYFGRGIQDMLISRLEWQEHLVHIAKEKVAESIAAAPASDAEAATGLGKVGADFLVWGSVTILGDQCSVDVRVMEKTGKTWPKNAQTTLAGLIPSLDGIARDINADLFQRPQAAAKAQQDAKQGVTPMNPDILVNESRADQVYLNPQFRYEGGDESPGRWRSPSLNFTSVGCVVGDLDGDGKNEAVFIDSHYVHAYEYKERRLQLLAEINPAPRAQLLNLNLIDLNRDGIQEIVVSADLDGMPVSFVLNYSNKQFKVLQKDIQFYMSVIKFPPTYAPVLVGQRPGTGKLFESTVHEVVRMSGEFKLGKRVAHPEGANVFNFAFLPQEGGDYKVILVTEQDHLQVYTPKFDLQHSTTEQFAGSSLGFERPDTMGGFGANRNMYTLMYYLPLRLVAVNLDKGAKHELLVNKNVSVASQFFQRYRYFPEGEIHSLSWDGVGLSLGWKTRRIKGTVADYGVADVDNDGKPDLYVCVNTFPGVSGFGDRKTILMTYALDLDTTSTPIPLGREE